MPPQPQVPGYSGPPQDQHLAEQERRLAQQERMLAQEERELARLERRSAQEEDQDRSRRRSRDQDTGRDGEKPEAASKTEGRRERDPGADAPPRKSNPAPGFPWSPGPEVRPADDRPPRAKEEELDLPRRRDDEEDQPPVRTGRLRSNQSLERDREDDRDLPRRPRNGHARPPEAEDPPGRSDDAGRGNGAGTGSRVFDEYWSLLDEATAQSAAAETSGGSPLDVNVIASLVYWVSLAKQRLGDQKLQELMELYLQSGHSRPGLQELLMHLHSIVAPAPPGTGQGNLEWVDLMFQLHGILTGGLPIGRMPAVALPAKPAPPAADPAAAKPTPPAAAPAAATPPPPAAAPAAARPAPAAQTSAAGPGPKLGTAAPRVVAVE
jgi:hypothetical protein